MRMGTRGEKGEKGGTEETVAMRDFTKEATKVIKREYQREVKIL